MPDIRPFSRKSVRMASNDGKYRSEVTAAIPTTELIATIMALHLHFCHAATVHNNKTTLRHNVCHLQFSLVTVVDVKQSRDRLKICK